MRKITIKKFSQAGSTIGAFLYHYIISFKEEGYGYTFHSSEEGMFNMIEIFKAAGHEVEFIDTKKTNLGA